MIFKQETVKSWFSGIKTSINNEVIQPFQNAEQVIWKYNQAIQHNSLTQKGWERLLAQSDDGLKAYLTNIKGTTASMTGYTVSLQGNITGFKKVSSAITQYNALATAGTQKQNEFSTAVAATNGRLGGYLRGLGGAKASLSGYVNSLVSATAKTIALQAATMALNAAVSMGITAAISLAVKRFDKLINSAKRASDAANEAFSESNSKVQQNKEEIKTLDELIQKYKELRENENLDTEGRKQVKNLQNDIADLVGVQAQNLDLVNGKLDEEIRKLNEISEKQAKNAYETATANYNNAVRVNKNAAGNSSIAFVDGYAYVGDREKEAEKILQDAGFINYYMQGGRKQVGGRGVGNNGFSTIVFDTYDRDGNLLKGAQEKADYLQSMIDVLEQNGQRASQLYDGLVKQRDIYLDYINDQKKAANSLIDSWITYSQYANEELSKINVDSLDTFEQYRQKMIDEAKSDDSIGQVLADGTLSEESLEIAINDFMSTATQFSEWYEQWADNVKSDTFNDKNPISSTITSSIEQIATQLEPQFAKLGDAYKDIFTTDGFTLDAVDNSMLEDLRKSFAEIEEEIGVTFDATQLENFFTVLSNNNSTAEQTQEAFDSIATSYLYSTDVLESLNSTTVDSIAKQLESLGITNASQLATEALAAKEEYLAFARKEHTDATGNLISVTQDLANATADDINVLIAEQDALEDEGIALDEATQKIIAYWMQKQAANGQLSTVGDIQQLGALCEALGVSSAALRNYIYFKKLASMTDVYDDASIERFSENAEKNMAQAQADIQSIYSKLGGAEINFAVPDTSKKSSSSSKSEKDTTKEFDWIEQAIENVEKEISNLDNIVNSAYSTFSQKNEALAKEIGKVNEEIQLQQQAYDEYMRKADSIGLSDDYKALIHDGAINIENISDEKLQEKISDYQQWYEKAVDASDAISELSTKVKDLHVAGYELQADRLEELLENESITEKRYLSEMDKLYKQYYENQTDYAVQAHEAKIALLNKEKEYLNSVANAAASLLDKEIDRVQDNAKEQQKPYEDQIKAAEKQKEIYQDQIKAEEKKIDAYNKEIDLINDRKKPLQDELDALEDKARQENLILDLQKKQYELKRSENQKDKLVNYMPDTIVI